MDPQTHRIAVIVGAVGLALCTILMVLTTCYIVVVRDGASVTALEQMTFGTLAALAVLVLGPQVVVTIAQMLGIRVPQVGGSTVPADPPSQPADTTNPPSAV